MKLIGYHGTTLEFKKRILKTNFTLSTDNNWFGRGLYLYDQDENMAKSWAQRRHKGSLTDVIKCEIEVDDDNVVDLINPRSDMNKEFHILRTEEIYKLIDSNNLKVRNSFGIDKVVIDMLFKSGIELFKCPSYTYTKEDEENGLNSRIPNGIEIIIRNLNLINEKR